MFKMSKDDYQGSRRDFMGSGLAFAGAGLLAAPMVSNAAVSTHVAIEIDGVKHFVLKKTANALLKAYFERGLEAGAVRIDPWPNAAAWRDMAYVALLWRGGLAGAFSDLVGEGAITKTLKPAYWALKGSTVVIGGAISTYLSAYLFKRMCFLGQLQNDAARKAVAEVAGFFVYFVGRAVVTHTVLRVLRVLWAGEETNHNELKRRRLLEGWEQAGVIDEEYWFDFKRIIKPIVDSMTINYVNINGRSKAQCGFYIPGVSDNASYSGWDDISGTTVVCYLDERDLAEGFKGNSWVDHSATGGGIKQTWLSKIDNPLPDWAYSLTRPR